MAINQLLRSVLTVELERPQGAYIAPTYGQAKRIAWSYCHEFAGSIPGTRFNEGELRIDFASGQRVWLLGSENPDRLRGLYLDYAVFDEYADINPRLFPEIIRPALIERNGGAMWIGTPRGHNHFWEIYETARSASEDIDSEWYACRHKASETKLIKNAELLAVAKTMSEEQYAQEFECSFDAAITGSYFSKALRDAETQSRIGRFPWEPLRPVHTAWDLGISDSTAVWFFQEGELGRRYIDYYEAAGEGLLHYAKLLSSKPYVYGEHLQPHDVMVRELGSGKSRLEMLRELGIRCRVVPRLTVQDGIEASRVCLQTSTFDAEACKSGLAALRQYRRSYDPARRDFSDRPLHDWTSHAADAFRISAVSRIVDGRENLKFVARTGKTEMGEQAVIGQDAEFD
ncbi:MAG: hypothetical protein VW709_09685 [Rickettsiales bacterium]